MTWAIIGLVICVLFYYVRKAGKDAVKADIAEQTVEDIVRANADVTDADVERVRKRWRRD